MIFNSERWPDLFVKAFVLNPPNARRQFAVRIWLLALVSGGGTVSTVRKCLIVLYIKKHTLWKEESQVKVWAHQSQGGIENFSFHLQTLSFLSKCRHKHDADEHRVCFSAGVVAHVHHRALTLTWRRPHHQQRPPRSWREIDATLMKTNVSLAKLWNRATVSVCQIIPDPHGGGGFSWKWNDESSVIRMTFEKD